MTISQRKNSLDLLRIVAVFMVIVNHCTDYFLNQTSRQLLIYIIESVASLSNPIFLMITGYFLLDREYKDIREFYRKSFSKIFMDVFIFSFLYFLWYLKFDFIRFLKTGEFNFSSLYSLLIKNLFGWTGSHLWYGYLVMGIYLILPFVSRAIRDISTRDYKNLTLIYSFWMIASVMSSKSSVSYSIHNVFSLFGYIFLGNYIKKIQQKLTINKKYFFVLFGTLILVLNGYLNYLYVFNYSGEFFNPYFNTNSSLLIVVGSIFIFCGFCVVDVNIDLYKISKYSFIALLLHKAILESIIYIYI